MARLCSDYQAIAQRPQSQIQAPHATPKHRNRESIYNKARTPSIKLMKQNESDQESNNDQEVEIRDSKPSMITINLRYTRTNITRHHLTATRF